MLRRILIIFFILITIIIAPHHVSALLNFEKDTNNPLNHSFFLLQSAISKGENDYKMWFTGHNGANLKIGYSTSADGINWPSHIFVSVNDSGDNHDPSVLRKDGSIYLYYISEPSEGSGIGIKIRRAITNGGLLSGVTNVSLARQPWNSQKLSCPYVYSENGNYFMFYCGTDGSTWNIGMGTSNDGINFIPCLNNPIIEGSNLGNTQMFRDESGTYHLLFHSDSGIEEVTTNALSCLSDWTSKTTVLKKDMPYDQSQIISPSLVKSGDEHELFYTARGPVTANGWRLNRAFIKGAKKKYILVPGFMGSWNKDAILHNQSVSPSDWKVPEFIEEYDGIIQTFENIGLEQNSDFYLFPYDWRKSIDATADDLHNFITTKVWNEKPGTKVSLIGHSMGGLLSRIYAQKYPSDRIENVVTLGTPHKGVVQTYAPLEAGETSKDDSFLWLATKLLINLNRNRSLSDREVVRQVFPSLFNIFPVFDFLQNKNGELVNIRTLSLKNNTLNTYSDISGIESKLTVIFGNKAANSSPFRLEVGKRALVDNLTKDYPDGRPLNTLFESGDYLVPTTSSSFGTNVEELELDHGEIIYHPIGQSKILDSLDLQYENADIQAGSKTILTPSLFITIQSPIEIYVTHNGQTYYEEDGVIFIPNAKSGEYQVNVKKMEEGSYTLNIGQIGTESDTWEKITATITNDAINEEDKFELTFNSEEPAPSVPLKRCKKAKKKFGFVYKKTPCLIKEHKIR